MKNVCVCVYRPVSYRGIISTFLYIFYIFVCNKSKKLEHILGAETIQFV